MKVTLDAVELIAIAIAMRAVRVLPVDPDLHSFPFLGVHDLEARDEGENDEDSLSRYTVSFKAEMHSGSFYEDEDSAAWPYFVLHIAYDNKKSEYLCESGQVRYDISEDRFQTVEFNATTDEGGNILIHRE